MIAQAIPPELEFDRNRVRDSLSDLRLGHDGLEQFVGLLFDEFDGLREQLDDDQANLDEERQRLRDAQAQIAAERNQWETDRQHWRDTLQKRVVELERDKLALASELESERRRCAEAVNAANDKQRHFDAERTEWMAELRRLPDRTREEDREMAAEGSTSEASVEPIKPIAERLEKQSKTDARRTTNERRTAQAAIADLVPPHKPAVRNPMESDPVMGPLLSQFQLLQRDVARRREKKA